MILEQDLLLIGFQPHQDKLLPFFHLFAKAKDSFGSSLNIVSDRLPSYRIPTKIIFNESKHIKVQSWYDDITNNLIESFFKRFKHKYKIYYGFKFEASVQALLQGFFFFYNYIIPHSKTEKHLQE